MRVSATTAAAMSTSADTVVIGLFATERVAHDVDGGLLQALLDRGEAKTAFEHLAVAHAGERRVILVGLGERSRFSADRARTAAAVAYGRAVELAASALTWEVPHHVDEAEVGALVEGTVLASYRFDRYKRAADTARRSQIESLTVSSHHDVGAAVEQAALIATAQNRVRDLVNRPANDLTPAALAAYAGELAAARPTLRVTVVDEDEIRASGWAGSPPSHRAPTSRRS